MKNQTELSIVGWRELILLPDFTDVPIKAKIDTGARTSAIHAKQIESLDREGHRWVRFLLDLGERHGKPMVVEAPLNDKRMITSSNGEFEERLIIKTSLVLGEHSFQAEFSLANRSKMMFPILIGRAALNQRFIVDPNCSYVLSSMSGN